MHMISIHPSRVGWDLHHMHNINGAQLFQSTHPVWDGTVGGGVPMRKGEISIHPSRVGWDGNERFVWYAIEHFNPPIPCGMGRESWTI